MDRTKLAEIAEKFQGKKIAVVGDISVDSYCHGKLRADNPDKKDKPLLTAEKEINSLGCGGNCAANVASLGGKAVFYGAIGEDSDGKIIEEICKNQGVEGRFQKDGKTIVKRRFLADEYIARVDYGESDLTDLSEELKEKVIEEIQNEGPDAIILSDYNKRAFRGNLAERIIRIAGEKGIPVIVDPKPANIDKFAGASVICPNLKEGMEITGLNGLEEIAKNLKEKIGCRAVVLTLSEDGMIVYQDSIKKLNSYAENIIDVMGAGDTLKAGIALAIASGADIFEAAEIGNIAAAIAVENTGTKCVTNQELIERIKEIKIPRPRVELG
ncbi:hypothetical protein CO038_02640 [Candidatus Pacearchaeota archaeon CG_4_9_14_0_2_um_filter_39_13]|nr:MAG: hypothetical protein AUJ64_00050 [Candidatus Pacearchaeota archaeon CG1_02_39_14]PJC44657.1 MAG: hypothetical protein CO038_02640 [Candidatus Pacearchaeota archaeon CG_4_9_14_0_2_um_filter_39_13]